MISYSLDIFVAGEPVTEFRADNLELAVEVVGGLLVGVNHLVGGG